MKEITDFIFGLKSIFKGMAVTIKHMFMPSATLRYPEKQREYSKGLRGYIVNEIDKCICCNLCKMSCPVECITINSEGKGKEKKLTEYKINYNYCLFCGLCVEACPTKSLFMTKFYNGASFNKKNLKKDYIKSNYKKDQLIELHKKNKRNNFLEENE